MSTETITINQVIAGIANGQFDDHIPLITNAIKARAELQTALLGLKPGDRVRIKPDSNLRPTYLLGIEGRVLKVNNKTATLVLDAITGRYGQGVRCPMSALEKVEVG